MLYKYYFDWFCIQPQYEISTNHTQFKIVNLSQILYITNQTKIHMNGYLYNHYIFVL